MSHGSGMYIMPHVMRLGVNVIAESGGFEPEEIFQLVKAWPGVSMFSAPTMIKRMVDCPADCESSNIRTIVWGGAPMYVVDVLRALDRFGPRFAQIHGQGECPMTITTLSKRRSLTAIIHGGTSVLPSTGRPYAGVDGSLQTQRSALPAGEDGEILCRGGMSSCPGYWRNPEATRDAFEGGWFHSGDLGVVHAVGYIQLKDRSKDLIISGGSNIYPREVEEVLLKHDKVREVSVIGRPDNEWGEIVVAYIVGEASAAELDALCLSSIARFKRPKDYVFMDTLPKNNYGKVLKKELRTIDAKHTIAN
jgi:long-chain acyl-CoA synthetase